MVWLLRTLRGRRSVSALCKVFGVGLVIVTLLQLTSSAPSRGKQNAKVGYLIAPFPDAHVQPPLTSRPEQIPDDPHIHRPAEPLRKLESAQAEHPVEQAFKVSYNQHQSREHAPAQPNKNAAARRNILLAPASRKGKFYEEIIVHFDLKGAPPRVPYFLQLLELIAASGATGVMIEWEDMFPYKGKLATAINTDAYSLDDIHTILQKAKSLGLTVIPLVQTFAHLEWILKLEEFRKYRTMDEYPQVLCLGNEDGVNLVKDTLKQVLDVHLKYGTPYVHIGCDEAFLFGACKEDVEWIRSKGPDGSKEFLALSHMKMIAEYVKEIAGEQTTILAWHDMLKNFPTQIIQRANVKDLIQPVIWDYSENIVTMNEWSFQALADNFPSVWASSAFKGANFPSAKYIDIRHYEANNRAWIDIVKNNGQRYREGFKGIIITGWQRYDHMAGLCEILPVGTPSMILQIETALSAPNKEDQQGIRRRAAKKLGCMNEMMNINGLDLINAQCNFTGFGAYQAFQTSTRRTMDYVQSEIDKHHPTLGWMNEYARVHEYTQNWYLRDIKQHLQMQIGQLRSSERQLRNQLNPLFFENTVEEFVFETIGSPIRNVEQMLADTDKLAKLRVWPKRNFAIKNEL